MIACPKMNAVRDKRYQRDAQHRQCRVIDPTTLERCQNSAVLAHVNIAGNFGRSLKAGDDEAIDLCAYHHDDFDNRLCAKDNDRALWLWRNVYRQEEKLNYQRWLDEHPTRNDPRTRHRGVR